jgi:hypothetical protein
MLACEIMIKGKIQAPIVIVITFLLGFSIFIAANITNNANSITNQPITTSDTNTSSSEIKDLVSKSLFINELMADNDRAVESVFGGHPDWLELYNSANRSVDLSGKYLSDILTKGTWQIPNGTIIQAQNYLIVWADADSGQAQLQTNFNLKANGGAIALFEDDRQTIIDIVLYDKQIRDTSYGRLPDGGSNWGYMTTPTAGKQNVANSTSNTSASWEMLLILILTLSILIAIALKKKIHAEGKA